MSATTVRSRQHSHGVRSPVQGDTMSGLPSLGHAMLGGAGGGGGGGSGGGGGGGSAAGAGAGPPGASAAAGGGGAGLQGASGGRPHSGLGGRPHSASSGSASELDVVLRKEARVQPFRRSSSRSALRAPGNCLACLPGNLCEGPRHSLSFDWCFDSTGSECVGLYLWLAKDCCWNTLHTPFPGLSFGVLAMIWGIVFTVDSLRRRRYYDAYLSFGCLLWVCSMFSWMLGENVALNAREYFSSPQQDEAFYLDGLVVARGIAVVTVAWFALFFAVLLPLDLFREAGGAMATAAGRPHSTSFSASLRRMPQPRLRWFFREFKYYKASLYLFWALKDTLWAFACPSAYAVIFFLVLAIDLDVIYQLVRCSGLYIESVQSIVLLFWVIANGIWAFGEMETEIALTFHDPAWAAYRAVGALNNDNFEARRAAGYVFGAAISIVLLFLAHWGWLTVRGVLPTYNHEDEDDDDAHAEV
jgi:hypothetical protein